MKLTKREKILIFVLLGLLFIFLFYKFIYAPQGQAIAELKDKALEYRKKVDTVETQLVSKITLQEEYKFANAKVDSITRKYVPQIIQEKLMVSLNEMIDKSGIELEDISYDHIQITDINGNEKSEDSPEETLMDELMRQYGLQDKANKEEKNKSEEGSLKILSMKAGINFYSSYDEAVHFLKLLESYEKRIVIESFNLQQTISQYGSIKGSISMVFYSLPQFDGESAERYNTWDINNTYGRDNPFNPFKGYTGSVALVPDSGSKNASIVETKFNFTLAVSPIMSDLPSVFMGRNDNSSGTQIYADSNSFEDVELQLMQKDGKYYCRYKTEKSSYPKNYNNNWMEFTPDSQGINLQIVSAPRTGSEDKTGANLSLINNTDLPLKVYVINDDKAYSRIKLEQQEGNINIIKE